MKLEFLFEQVKEKSPESPRENLAKTSTLYSDTPVSLRLQITKPIEGIAAYYLSLYFKEWNTDVLVRSIAYRAYSNNYQGKWKLVQEILELPIHTPQEMEEWYKDYNPSEFYGNVLPLSEELEKRVVYKDPRRGNFSKVRRGIRRRGYKDKGSRRLPHEMHGDPPLPIQREDRRLLVSHPLVGKLERKNQPGFQDMSVSTSQEDKEEN